MGRRIHGCGGFTLIEMLAVVMIIGLLAAVIAPRFMGRTEEAKQTQAAVQIKQLKAALDQFHMDNGFYPSTRQGLEALVSEPKVGREVRHYPEGGYLQQESAPLDPWGNPYVYISPGQHGPYDLYSRGADGEKGGSGYDADIQSWNLNQFLNRR